VVAAENLRNEESRRHGGSAREPGSYRLAVDAARLLSGQSLGLDIDSLKPTSILVVETADIPRLKHLSLYAVSFDTAFTLDAAPGTGDISDFNLFHADWDPAPFGHVDPNALPDANGAAIGADSIILRQDQ
jgi:hypothetical protein